MPARRSPGMAIHETLAATFGPFLIPVVLFVFGGVVYVALWWLGEVALDGDRSQR